MAGNVALPDTSASGVDADDSEAGELDVVAAMRSRTRRLHTQAERSGILRDLLRGRGRVVDYALLIRNLHPVYAAMESALLDPAQAEFGALSDERLFRAHRLRADLEAVGGSAWREELAELPVARRYAARVRLVGRDEPVRLIGHIYTRYLGDLSGGQIIKRILTKSMALPESALGFYDFAALGDVQASKKSLLRSMRTLVTGTTAINAAADEAAVAFRFNIEMSEAIAAVADDSSAALEFAV